MKDILTLAAPAWNIVLRTAVVYVVTLTGLRLAGKREMGQMTVFDLVVLLLIANSLQNAMVGPDDSLTGGILAAAVLLSLNAIVAWLQMRWSPLRRMIEGSPTLLVLHGKVLDSNMRREGVSQDALDAAIREHGIAEAAKVDIAVLEIDGSISVVPAEEGDGEGEAPPKRRRKFIKRE